jgi:hypothetical protein
VSQNFAEQLNGAMLENNEKNNKKNSIPLIFEDMGAQKVQL